VTPKPLEVTLIKVPISPRPYPPNAMVLSREECVNRLCSAILEFEDPLLWELHPSQWPRTHAGQLNARTLVWMKSMLSAVHVKAEYNPDHLFEEAHYQVRRILGIDPP
jgi:hypothetical protein